MDTIGQANDQARQQEEDNRTDLKAIACANVATRHWWEFIKAWCDRGRHGSSGAVPLSPRCGQCSLLRAWLQLIWQAACRCEVVLVIGSNTYEVKSSAAPDASAGMGVLWRVMCELQ